MIRKFIIQKNGMATKNDVIKHLERYSSRVPTLDMITELEEAGIITVDRNDNRKGQSHYLKINDENEFNKINRQISDIDYMIDTIEKPMDSILKILSRQYGPNESLRQEIIFAYKRSIEKILLFLLVHTSDKITSEKSAQILYAKIIKSMQRLEHQYFYSESLDSLNKNVDTIRSILSMAKTGPYNRHKVSAFKYLIRKILEFKERFKS